MRNEDLSTVQSELVLLDPLHTFMELRTLDKQGVNRLPFWTECLEFTVNDQPWSLTLTEGALTFRSSGEVVSAMIGQDVVLTEARVRVVDLRTLPPYWLVALSPELQHKSWPVGSGSTGIGRPGKRLNAVILEHLSISRTHATIEVDGPRATVRVESNALSAVNGVALKNGATTDLQPNDILQLGDIHLRWEKEDGAVMTDGARLNIRGLGQARVLLDELEIRWHNEHAQDLIFWLASSKDAELSVTRVLEEYWPERSTLRQRKNLSHVLRKLQGELGLSQAAFGRLLIRSPEALRLNSDLVATCDFWMLKSAALSTNNSEFDFKQSLGIFFPGNDRPWARTLRRELLLFWFQALGQIDLSPTERSCVLERTTQILREVDFDEFVHRTAVRMAENLGEESYIALWSAEARKH